MPLQLFLPGRRRAGQLPDVQLPAAMNHEHRLAQRRLARRAHARRRHHLARVALGEELIDHIEHGAALHRIGIGRDDRREVQHRAGDPGYRAPVETLQIGDERRHIRVIQREVRHQIIERLALRVEPLADRPRERRFGIRLAVAAHPLDVGQIRVLVAWPKQITSGDRWNGDTAFPGAQAAALVAFGAGRIRALRAHGIIATRRERLPRPQNAAPIDGTSPAPGAGSALARPRGKSSAANKSVSSNARGAGGKRAHAGRSSMREKSALGNIGAAADGLHQSAPSSRTTTISAGPLGEAPAPSGCPR